MNVQMQMPRLGGARQLVLTDCVDARGGE